jgi:hypothetical protein
MPMCLCAFVPMPLLGPPTRVHSAPFVKPTDPAECLFQPHVSLHSVRPSVYFGFPCRRLDPPIPSGVYSKSGPVTVSAPRANPPSLPLAYSKSSPVPISGPRVDPGGFDPQRLHEKQRGCGGGACARRLKPPTPRPPVSASRVSGSARTAKPRRRAITVPRSMPGPIPSAPSPRGRNAPAA